MTNNFRKLLITSILLAITLSCYAVKKVYDPTRDPVADLKAAQTQAASEHKLILLDVAAIGAPGASSSTAPSITTRKSRKFSPTITSSSTST